MDKLNSDLLVVVLAILTDAVPQSAAAEALQVVDRESGSVAGGVAQDSRRASTSSASVRSNAWPRLT